MQVAHTEIVIIHIKSFFLT